LHSQQTKADGWKLDCDRYVPGSGKLSQDSPRTGYVVLDLMRVTHARAFLEKPMEVSLGPTCEGRLYLSGRRNLRTRIRGLEVIQNVAPRKPSLGMILKRTRSLLRQTALALQIMKDSPAG
jgi:hypothetical protein